MIRSAKNFLSQQYHNRKRKQNFQSQLKTFTTMGGDKRFSLKEEDQWACLDDATSQTGFDHHYIYHPAWAARIVQKINPQKHIDISSALSFCSMLSAFIPVEFYDYRPAPLTLSNLKSGEADLCNLFFETESVESISCMHTIEHVGLGRYGDPIDPDADVKAINELKRVVKKNGHLIFVTPVGVPRIQFNAHRIYSFEMIMDLFSGFALNDFSLVLDNGDFVSPAKPELVKQQRYGCGCFWFSKK
jgi:SAM-dependent methyltransferase